MIKKEEFEHIKRESIGAGLAIDESYELHREGVDFSIYPPAQDSIIPHDGWSISAKKENICKEIGYGDSKSSHIRYWENLPSFESAAKIVEDILIIIS